MQTATAQFIYRPYRESDIDGILRLWEQYSGWGKITRQTFLQWMHASPYGDSLMIVVTDENDEIKGQAVFTPTRVSVGGTEVKSVRISSPILDDTLRQGNLRSIDHPSSMLFVKGLQLAAKNGYQFAYSFPSVGWINLAKHLPPIAGHPFETAVYNCFSIALAPEQHSIASTCYAKVIQKITADHENIWLQAVEKGIFRCGVSRHKAWVNWAEADSIKLETRNLEDGHLLGYAIIKKDGFLKDLIAGNENDFLQVFSATVTALREPQNNIPFNALKGIVTPHTSKWLQQVDHCNDSYRFAFVGHMLDASLPVQLFHSSNWYMMPIG